MPPKKKSSSEPSKKTEQKKKEKVVEDKTFGMKNKKGAQTQKLIQQIQKSYAQPASKDNQPKAKKEEKKKEAEELNQIFRPVVTQKVHKGVDPKSVLCAFYKQGQCTKGDKCKFSHDVNIERKSEKKNIYCDVREDEDSMENWDENKLKEVVEKKHGESERKMPKTDIICRFFLEALESNKYGWFWNCANGENCHYRHALPQGFVLNKDRKKNEKKDEISIEELVENERSKLDIQTKITLETFLIWKKKKLAEKKEACRKEDERKREEFKAGRHIGLSGRDMFTFNPDLVVDDLTEDGEGTFDKRDSGGEEEEEGDVKIREITFDLFIPEEELEAEIQSCKTQSIVSQNSNNANVCTMAADLASSRVAGCNDIPIDEDLFAEDDLSELEEEMDELKID